MNNTTTTPELDIQTGLAAILAAKKKTYPVHVNRISQLDDPCLRRLFYMRHDWDKAQPYDDRAQGIFETGNILESVIGRIVSEVGEASTPKWRIVGQQATTEDTLLKKYQISGSIDGFLQVFTEGKWVTVGVIDIKTMNPNIFSQVADYASLAKYPWTRKYRGQVMIYSLAHNLPMCFLLLVNKSNLYEMRLLGFPLDMEYCEGLLQKAEAVNLALEADAAPEKINDPEECPRCPWRSFCCPDFISGGNLQVVSNDELEGILNRLEELETTSDEISELEKQRDGLLVRGQDIACGHWLVTWKKTISQLKAREASTSESWRKKIVRA
jgi:hypothetical protein